MSSRCGGAGRRVHRARRSAAAAHPDQRQVDRVLPQLVAGPGRRWSGFMNRSIDLLEEMARSERRPLRDEPERLRLLHRRAGARRPARAHGARDLGVGAGELRIHRGAMSDPPFPEAPYDKLDPSIGGADLVLDPQTIHCRFPFLNPATIGRRSCRGAAAGSRRSSSACGCSSRRATPGVELVEGD